MNGHMAMTSRRTSLSLRQFLAKVHLWVGVILCIPLGAIGITGSILVFEHEITDLIDPPPVRHSTGSELKNLAEIVAAARQAAPANHTPTSIAIPKEEREAAIVRLLPPGRATPGSGGLQIYIDPATLQVLGIRQPTSDSVMRQIFRLHANMLVQGRTGREIVGWFGVAMLILGTSGLIMWWPRGASWRTAFGVQRDVRGFRLHRQLHGAVGIWGLAVFMVVSFSGVYISFPQQLGDVVRSVTPGRDLRGLQNVRVTQHPVAEPLDIDSAVSLARTEVEGAVLRSVFLAVGPDRPIRATFSRYGFWQGIPLSTVLIDPWERRVIGVYDPQTYSAGELFMAWQRALHAGSGLGWTYRILVFLSGFLPPLFAITGVAMWLMKRRSRRSLPSAAD